MGQVTAKTVFSGGVGNLTLTFSFPLSDVIFEFTQNSQGPFTKTVPEGDQVGSVEGSAPNGPGGNISLQITGDVSEEITKNYKAGLILPQPIDILVIN